MRRKLAVPLLALATATVTHAAPPPTAVEPVKEVLHGIGMGKACAARPAGG